MPDPRVPPTLDLLHKSHPWHGVDIGSEAPRKVTVYVEIVPTDTVKYELDKVSGILKIDRPQLFSNVCPSPYGLLPRTLCAEKVAAFEVIRHSRDDYAARFAALHRTLAEQAEG